MNYQKVIIPVNPITNTTDTSLPLQDACKLESKTAEEFATRGAAVVKHVLCQETISGSVTKFYEWLESEPRHDEIVAIVQLMGLGMSAIAKEAVAEMRNIASSEMRSSGTVH